MNSPTSEKTGDKPSLARLVRRLMCKFGRHKFEAIDDNPTIFQCASCGEFKMGEAKTKDGDECFVFRDGSAIVAKKFNHE